MRMIITILMAWTIKEIIMDDWTVMAYPLGL
jgi:hypothetical protein